MAGLPVARVSVYPPVKASLSVAPGIVPAREVVGCIEIAGQTARRVRAGCPALRAIFTVPARTETRATGKATPLAF